MASIDGESLELEVKHKENGSWHPCRVSLSSNDSKFDLIVDIENSNEEDTISNREDALDRLRFRSTPLQDGECSHIKEGDTVLAMYKDQFRSFFFDAVIKKLHRVRHSNRVFCRCTFEIKWLNADLKEETMTIPSKSIMRLSTEVIGRNSTFSSFLNSLSTKDGAEAPLSPLSFSLFEEASSEANLLQEILERQIEEISKLADGPMGSSADLLEVRSKLGGGKQSKAALSSHVTSISNQNGFRRSSRSQRKEQNEGELKKKPEEDKPFLTPLAARAAFASLIHEHELPLKREHPFHHAVKEDQERLLGKDIKVHSLNVRHDRIRYDASSHDSIPYLSSPVSNADRRVESRVTSRHSTQKGTPKSTRAKERLYMEKSLEVGEESEDEKWSTIVNKSSDSRKVGKLTAQSMATRVTRSSANKEEVLSNEVMEMSSRVPTRKTRTSAQTRSGKQKEQGNPGTDHHPRQIDMIQDTDGMSEESEGMHGPTITNNSTYTTTVVNQSGWSSSNRATRSSLHKEHEASPDEVKIGSSSKKIISPNARLARSRPQTQEINAGVVHNENKKRMPISTPAADAGNKRTRSSLGASVITVASGSADDSMEDGESETGEKRKTERKRAASTQKPQLRSSPRLKKA